jgi:hypothetical protein
VWCVCSVLCRGVATITSLCVYRQDAPAGSQQQQQECRSADPQPHVLHVWPEWSPCEDPLMQPALQLAEPVNRLPLQLSVLPSNMPAELLMTYSGEVSAVNWGRTCSTPTAANVGWLSRPGGHKF